MTIEIFLSVGMAALSIIVTILLAVINSMSARIRAVEEKFERYVRRDDLNGHLATIDRSMTEVKVALDKSTTELRSDMATLTKILVGSLVKTKE